MAPKKFLFRNTFDTFMKVPNKDYSLDVITFDTMDEILSYVNELFPNYNSTNIIDAPINNKDEYWNIERNEIKKRTSFRMPLFNSDDEYIDGERYVVFYDGNSDTTYVVDIQS